MKILICLLVALLSFNVALAQSATTLKNEENLSLERLKIFVADNNIKTLDELIPNLPDHMLSNSMLVYNSKALNLPRVTPETPRVIMFNKKASLILAFTKHPGNEEIASGRDTLEVIAINDKTKRFDFFDIPFDGKNQPFKTALQPNPPLCLTCHGQNPRPIFNEYNSWPGFYGSFGQEGMAITNTKEFEFLKKFLNGRKALKRYADLKLDHVKHSTQGYAIPAQGYEGDIDYLNLTPALAFGATMELRLYERLAKKLESIPSSQKYMNIISYLGRSNECGNEYSHRKDVKDLFTHWLTSKNYIAEAKTLEKLLEKQIKDDFNITNMILLEFNLPSKEVDSRGLMNIPYETFFLNVGDKDALAANLIITESISRDLQLQSEDFSTTPGRPTSGIFHIRKLYLTEDEQIIKGLYEGLVRISSPLVAAQRELSCADIKKQAYAEIQNLVIASPNQSGTLYYK